MSYSSIFLGGNLKLLFFRRQVLESVIIAAFACFSLIGILNHEMWVDELQAWMIARDSASLGELFNNLEHEGHPLLWYICLYGLNLITDNPLIMQIFHLLIALGVVVLFTKFSPFSILHKFLFSFSYFSFFEYGIISRGYSLGVLFTFLFCYFYRRSKKNHVLLACLLVGLANTSAYGLALSGALSLLLVSDILTNLNSARRRFLSVRQAVIGICILLLGWLASFLQIARPLLNNPNPPQSWVLSGDAAQAFALTEKVLNLARIIVGVWKSYVPVPMPFQINFWESNILNTNDYLPTIAGQSTGSIAAVILSVVLLITSLLYLSRKPILAFVYVLGSIFIFSIGLFYVAALRHNGHYFVLLITCFWLYLSDPAIPKQRITDRKWLGLSWQPFLTILLFLQMLSGVYAVSLDILYPFSESRATAAFIQENNLHQLPILGEDRSTSAIPGYINREVYYLTAQEFGTFWRTAPPRIEDETRRIELLNQGLAQVEGDRALVILTSPTYLTAVEGFGEITEIARFDRPTIYERVGGQLSSGEPLIYTEKFYLYLAQRALG
jgi:uncharacterized membrane protein YiaA